MFSRFTSSSASASSSSFTRVFSSLLFFFFFLTISYNPIKVNCFLITSTTTSTRTTGYISRYTSQNTGMYLSFLLLLHYHISLSMDLSYLFYPILYIISYPLLSYFYLILPSPMLSQTCQQAIVTTMVKICDLILMLKKKPLKVQKQLKI